MGMFYFIIFIIIAFIIILFFKKRKKKISSFLLCIAAGISCLFSSYIVDLLPPIKEQVTICATGEKNKQSVTNEVSLHGIIIDGKEIEIPNAIEGKWFWKGEDYVWRNETDPRQPEGTTREIIIELPVAKERVFIFNNCQYRGIIEIKYNNQVSVYDLYRPTNEMTEVALPSSSNSALCLLLFRNIFLFIIIFLLFLSFPFIACIKYNETDIKKWLTNNYDIFIYAVLGFATMILLNHLSKNSSCWYDEIFSLGWIYGDPPDGKNYIYLFLLNLWVKIMPYGQEYLWLLTEIFIFGTIIIAGLIGRNIKDKSLGILLSTLIATSSTVYSQCIQLRPYGMILFFSSLMLYFFIKKQQCLNNPKYNTIILYSISIVATMDCHDFGIAVAGLLMIFDLILILKKKASTRYLIEFILPSIYGVYYLLTRFITHIGMAEKFGWIVSPTINNTIDIIIKESGGTTFNFILLILGVFLIIAQLVYVIQNKQFNYNNDFIMLVVLSVPLLTIGFEIVYSVIINPNMSLHVDRYFTPIIIFLTVIIGMSLHKIIEFILSSFKKLYTLPLVLSIMISMCTINWRTYQAFNFQNYREVADYVMSQNDTYLDSTAFVITGDYHLNDGITYYTTHKGKRDDIKHFSVNRLPENIYEYETIYYCYLHSYISVHPDFYEHLSSEYTMVENDSKNKLAKFIKNK